MDEWKGGREEVSSKRGGLTDTNESVKPGLAPFSCVRTTKRWQSFVPGIKKKSLAMRKGSDTHERAKPHKVGCAKQSLEVSFARKRTSSLSVYFLSLSLSLPIESN